MKEAGELLDEFVDPEYRHGYADDFLNACVGAQIRALRVQRGWTQKELARRAGMRQPRIHEMEDINYGSWTVRTLARLAEAFDVALDVRFTSFAARANDIVGFSIEGLHVLPYDEVEAARVVHVANLVNWSA